MDKTSDFDGMDMLLYEAVRYSGRNEIAEYQVAKDASVTLSEKRTHRIIRLLYREDKRLEKETTYYEHHRTYRPIREMCKRVAVVVLLVMSLGTVGMFSIESVRIEVFHAVTAWFREKVNVRFPDSAGAETAPETILEYKEPVIGKQFTKLELLKTPYEYTIEYNKEQYSISYAQSIIAGYEINVSNENSVIQDITISGHNGVMVSFFSGSQQLLTFVWNDGDYAYSLSGNVPYEELMQIAESIP